MAEAKTVKTIVDFEMIFDIDFTVIDFIRSTFKNSKYFIPSLFTDDVIILRALLRNRECQNPVKVFIKDEYESSADKIYIDILTSDYMDTIYSNIYLTGLAGYFKTLTKVDKEAVYLEVYCRNDIEEHIVRNTFTTTTPDIITDLNDSLSKDDAKSYFIKDMSILEKMTKIPEKKSLIMADYGFNVSYTPMGAIPKDEYMKDPDIIKNELNVISIYPDIAYGF